MERRNFLKSLFVWGSMVLSPFVQAQKSIEENTKTEVEMIVSKENIKKYTQSLQFIGKREMELFLKFFQISETNPTFVDDFIVLVKKLQTELWINQKKFAWIITSVFLEKLYKNYYLKNPDLLDQENIKRWNIYQEMLGYKGKKWALFHSLNVFSYNDYYGMNVWINQYGTFINEHLVWKIPQSLWNKQHKILISQINKKKVLSFYVAWELYLATYVSPWLLDHKTPKLQTTGKISPDKYHTSSEYPEAVKSKNKQKWWAVMPYAVHIDGWVRIHGSPWTINGNPASHGCIRTPLFYVKEIYDKVSQLWYKNISIDTRWIY